MSENAAATELGSTVRRIELAELERTDDGGRTLLDENSELIRSIKVRLSVSIGRCELTVKDLLALQEDAVLALDKDTRAPVDVLLDGKVIARGHLVAVDDNFGVRISEICAV